MNDTGIAFCVIRDAQGGESFFAGENLRWMQEESLQRGITMEELWAEVLRDTQERIQQKLKRN
jgi:hypothetical protein